MARDDTDNFRIRPGRSRDRGTAATRQTRSFTTQVKVAVRRAGGDPNQIGATRSSGRRAGVNNARFNARGRGARVMASLPVRDGQWQRDSAGRYRSRRVVVKARVVKLNPLRGSRGASIRRGVAGKAADAHLRYLERDGVTQDGEKARAYSALGDEADGKAFIERGRGDRHQFRFIVAPEDSADMDDLRSFTRNLMRQVEVDLGTKLDWIAVDHHNTGHPHTHILVRGITEDGKILNIAGDYIAQGVRYRASELVTKQLGHQSEIELQTKLQSEVQAERLTRLDKVLLAEQQDHAVIDLRPGQGASYLVRENRTLMISRAKKLERFGLATEIDPGRWVLSEKAEPTLRALGDRNDIIKTMHRALTEHGLAEQRGADQYVRHGASVEERVVGRVLSKGLAGDELGERVYLIVDGVDGRVHHMEFIDTAGIEEVRRGMIVEAGPPASGPRSADRNIAINAEGDGGVYQPSRHLARISESFDRQGKDPEAFVRFHVRRLEALRRAGHVERIDEDHWRIPKDIVDRGQTYDLSQGNNHRVRVLSTFDLERQIPSDGATWLDRELAARNPLPIRDSGFGRAVNAAFERRAEHLAGMGHTTTRNGKLFVSPTSVAFLERQEIERAGMEMASARGRIFQPAKPGEYLGGTLVGSTNLASGRFAMLETFGGDGRLGFTLVPWQPVLESRIGLQISGVVHDGGAVDWSFGRKLGQGL